MQAAGDLVSPAAELSPGMEDGQADLHRRPVHLRMHAHRESAAVVLNHDAPVLPEHDVNLPAEAGQRLVHGVIHDFIDQMMQSAHIRRADIHARPLPHGLQALQHLNLILAVIRGYRHFLFQIQIQFFRHDVPFIVREIR